MADPIPLPLDTIRAAYSEQCRRSDVALRTQIGDAYRLGQHREDCLRLLRLVEQVRSVELTNQAL
jgi:hypothetical protein